MGLLRSLRDRSSVTVFRHTVGNALVLHARERISSEARAVALAVADDPDNEIVVLDLHDDLPVGIWKSVAEALRRRRRGIRLVVCGAHHDTAALAAQWLSDRLRRPVVTPHGRLIRGAAGTLFAHAGQASGWVRYRPGRPPTPEAKRHPAPPWDDAAAEFVATSAVGAVEPIPAGVWIRDTRDPALVSDRWRWLVAAVPCQRAAMTVVLGCPGTPPLALDDVARFWRGLAPAHRQYARFVQYGPVQLPAGEPLGQRLADLLEAPVVCFAGIPVGRADRPHMHTVTQDGRLGWHLLVRELGFTPRSRPTAPAAMPRILHHQAPTLLGAAVGPRTYGYTDDAVVEIVQSGLWIRGTGPTRNADRIRARAADPAAHALIIDDSDPARVARLRELAEDLAARLDPPTRARSALQLASAVAVRRQRPTAAAGTLGDGLTYRFTAADLALDEAIDVAPPPAEALAGRGVAGVQSPSWARPADPPIPPPPTAGELHPAAREFLAAPAVVPPAPPPGPAPDRKPGPALAEESGPSSPAAGLLGTRSGRPAGGRLGPVERAPGRGERTVTNLPVLTSRMPGRAADHAVDTPLWEQSVFVDAPTRTAVAPPSRPAGPPSVAAPPRPAGRPVVGPLPAREPAAPSSGAAPSSPTSLPPPPSTFLPPPPPVLPAPPLVAPTGDAPEAAQEPTSTVASRSGDAAAGEPSGTAPVDRPALRFQTAPALQARGLPTARGLDVERTWLRGRLGREFDAAASSVSRVLSEHPRLSPDEDALTDAVAVRLYLSALGAEVDEALRGGGHNDQVLFARCVAAGISRLPSHRGGTCAAATLTGDELHEIRARGVLTDRAFTHALIEPPVDLPGTVEVLLWSMTARRTGLLEPADDQYVEGRVLFLPGTRFKVLEVTEPTGDERGRVLLRELSADEPVRAHGPFDDLALTSLYRCVERWATVGRRRSVGAAASRRFAALPGLV
ncbi:hypothetical protein [Polymorphospora rubra]|uniref:hypothetical protein n=1 Tax=Polymorphospora rubra TaxID=338584 RepID=UPI0031D99BA3